MKQFGPNYKLAMNIVNQLFDEAKVSVEQRQAINDKCTRFVDHLLTEALQADASRLDWIEKQEYRLIPTREKSSEGYEIWWYVTDRRSNPVDHPHGNVREAIDGAIKADVVEMRRRKA